ncbi:MAG: hypothetical protein ACTSU5_12775 [Promethearchaeota archaeon]
MAALLIVANVTILPMMEGKVSSLVYAFTFVVLNAVAVLPFTYFFWKSLRARWGRR